MLTKKEYNIVKSDEDFPVIFGFYNIDNHKLYTALGKRSGGHGDQDIIDNAFGAQSNNFTFRGYRYWRYVPLTKTLYWWDTPTDDEKELTIQTLKQKYNEVPQTFLNLSLPKYDFGKVGKLAAGVSSHGPYVLNYAYPPKKMPSFKDWYKTHQSD